MNSSCQNRTLEGSIIVYISTHLRVPDCLVKVHVKTDLKNMQKKKKALSKKC